MRDFFEVAPKLFDGFFLLFIQVIKLIIKLLQVRNIPEQVVGIEQVFVDVVKIGQQNFTPKEKFVQRFLMAGHFAVNLLKFKYQGHLIGQLQARKRGDQFVYGGNFGRKHGILNQLIQVSGKKNTSSPARKNQAEFAQFITMIRVQITGNLF